MHQRRAGHVPLAPVSRAEVCHRSAAVLSCLPWRLAWSDWCAL